MTSRDFAYWLQGYFEIENPIMLDEEDIKVIRNHLNLVFKHDIDKQYKDGDGTQEVHDGKQKPDQLTLNYNPNDTLLRC